MTKIYNLSEGMEIGDLQDLMHPELHIDEYKSKLGKDEDVCVISLKISEKLAASDLIDFIEKGYDWVIDADLSSGEMDDGDYIVFVEIDRNKDIAKNIMRIMSDIMKLTKQHLTNWRARYYKSSDDYELTLESLTKMIPGTPEQYRKKYGIEDLDKLRTAAGVKVNTNAPKNEYTKNLKAQAGID